MIALLIAISSPFTSVSTNDPITMEAQTAFAVQNEDGDVLMLACRPAKHEIDLVVLPKRYLPPSDTPFMFLPRADSRFGLEIKPDKDSWYLDKQAIYYVGHNYLNQIPATAGFIDRLAHNHEFNIRWSSYQDDVHTIQFAYTLDLPGLRSFLGLCGPRRVIAELQRMGSPAAP